MQQGMDPNLCEKKEMEEEISPRQKEDTGNIDF